MRVVLSRDTPKQTCVATPPPPALSPSLNPPVSVNESLKTPPCCNPATACVSHTPPSTSVNPPCACPPPLPRSPTADLYLFLREAVQAGG